VSVVSDASPLVSLARLGHLELLHALYGDVLVPEAVWQELVVQGAGQPGAAELGRAPWIRRCTVGNRPLVEALWQHLGAGEAEAIALALVDRGGAAAGGPASRGRPSGSVRPGLVVAYA
jgi:predicted nucleic acid-binding protein